MYALIRVDAHGSRIGQPKRPTRPHPVSKETMYEPLTEFELQGFDQPPLRHIEGENASRNQKEDDQLEEKLP